MAPRINLVTNPSFESNLSGWAASTNVSSITQSGNHWVGSFSLRATVTAIGTSQVTSTTGTGGIPVVAGSTVAVAAYFLASAVGRTGTLYLNYYDSTGAYVSTGTVGSAALSNTNWVQVSGTTTIPAGISYAAVVPALSSAAASEFWYIDGVLFEQSATVGSYFDGTIPGAFWTGTAGASTSYMAGTATNYCTNPSFEVSAANWSTVTVSLVKSSAQKWQGTSSGLVTWPGTSAGRIVHTFSTVPGLTYRLSGYVYVPSGSVSVGISVDLTAFGVGSAVNDQWTRLNLSFTATASSHSLMFYNNGTPAAAQTFYVDGVLIEQSSALNAYYDGYTPGAWWLGTMGLSASSQGGAPWPIMAVQADWQHGPNDGVQTWTSLQSRGNTIIDHVAIGRGRQYELDKVESGTMTIDIDDQSEYLNPANASSPWNSGSNTLKPYRQIQATANWNGTNSALFSGYVERIQESWSDVGFRGTKALTCVDAMAMLTRRTYQSIVQEQIEATSPTYYLPLNDGNGSAYARNYTGWPSFGFKWQGAISGSYSFGTSSPAGIWDTSWLSFSGSGTCSYQLTAPSVSGATWTMQIAFQQKAKSGTGANLWTQQTGGEIETGVYAPDTAGGVSIYYETAGSGQWAAPITIPDDGQPHVIHVVANGGAGVSVYADGVAVSTGNPAASVTAPSFSQLNNETTFIGSVAHFATWQGTALTSLQVGYLAGAILNGNQAPTGSRITTLLQFAPWTGYGSNLDTGKSTEYGAIISGKNTKTVLEQCATTESGLVYITGDGEVRFKDRGTLKSSAINPLYTFGDGYGELPYESDITFSLDPTRAANMVSVTQPDGYYAYAQDATSISTYGPISLNIATDFSNDVEAANVATWYRTKYKDPIVRVEKITLDPSSNPNLWAPCLTLDIGDCVTVNRRPSTAFSFGSTYIIQKVEHDIQAGSWRTNLWLSPASLLVGLIIDDATYGAIDTWPIPF